MLNKYIISKDTKIIKIAYGLSKVHDYILENITPEDADDYDLTIIDFNDDIIVNTNVSEFMELSLLVSGFIFK